MLPPHAPLLVVWPRWFEVARFPSTSRLLKQRSTEV